LSHRMDMMLINQWDFEHENSDTKSARRTLTRKHSDTIEINSDSV
jgi:hypothetical protein